jgi:hypothetical protein
LQYEALLHQNVVQYWRKSSFKKLLGSKIDEGNDQITGMSTMKERNRREKEKERGGGERERGEEKKDCAMIFS